MANHKNAVRFQFSADALQLYCLKILADLTQVPYSRVCEDGPQADRDARIGTEAGWATNPETLGKDSYNPTLTPRAWGYIQKLGRCFWCFQKWRPGHVCDRDTPREIPSLQVRSKTAAVSELPDKMPESECKQKSLEDEMESILPCQVNHSPKQQNVSKAITVHSSLAAISAVCKEVTDMDLQTNPKPSQTYQKQQSWSTHSSYMGPYSKNRSSHTHSYKKERHCYCRNR